MTEEEIIRIVEAVQPPPKPMPIRLRLWAMFFPYRSVVAATQAAKHEIIDEIRKAQER